jgi:multidrug efflux system outer membrane protein
MPEPSAARMLVRLTVFALALAWSGCSMAPRYERPTAPVAKRFAADAPAGDAPDVLGYKEFFRDPRLARLIQLALQENRELRVAKLSAERLRAQYRIQRAALAPRVDAVGARNQQRTISPLFPDNAISYTQYTLSVGVMSYELDFFGRIQSLKDQALETYLASLEAQRSAELSLVASVATQYFAELALREQLARATKIRGSADAARELTARSFEVGSKSALDLRSADALVASLDAEISVLAQRLDLARNALALLVGKAVPLDLPEPLPLDQKELLPSVRPGLPSQLIERRPDILAAEHALRAANANIGAARAAFFPRISLTAAGGAASDDFLGLFAAGSGTWQFMPQVSIPLFAAGSRFADLEASKVQKLTEVARYERAIQVAFREVADALASQKHLTVQLAAREAAAAAQAERYTLAEARYKTGIDSYLTVLTAQQDLFAAEQTLVAVRLEELSTKIALYRALGGGFK